jgi:hypothetical protein
MSEREVRLKGPEVAALEQWCSIWGDLQQVEMALHARDALSPGLTHHFPRRALWEAAVAAYGRVFKAGRRQVRPLHLLDQFGSEARRVHEEVMHLRDKHVSHRVSADHEKVSVRGVVDSAGHMKNVAVRVCVAAGPADATGATDDALAYALQELVAALKLVVWEQEMGTLGRQLVQLNADRSETLVAMPTASSADDDHGEFTIVMRICGSPAQAGYTPAGEEN